MMPLPWTVVLADKPLAEEKSREEPEQRQLGKASSFSCSFTLDSYRDSTRFVTIAVDGREVQVQVDPSEKDRWKVPCTYILDNGEVVYHYCDGLHHTPHQGQERWKISESRAGLLYVEHYLDTASHGPYPIDPEDVFGKRPVPFRLEYFNAEYTRHLRFVDLSKANPYSREKMPDIELEQAYDAELGLSPEDTTKTAYLWTWSWVHFFDSGHAGVCWRLQRYSGGRGLQGFTSTISILDQEGKEIFYLADVGEDISPALMTPDGKYMGVVLNKEIDINVYSKRLGFPGIRIYNTTTNNIVYEDMAKTDLEQIGVPVVYRKDFIGYRRVMSSFGNSIGDIEVIIDLENKLKYERHFSKEEWSYISKHPYWLNSYPRGLLDVYDFTISKF